MDLPPLTRFAYLARQGHSRRKQRWTRHSALVALGLYVREEGAYPRARHLHNQHGLPSYDTIKTLFGTPDAYRNALPRALAPVLRQTPSRATGARGPYQRARQTTASLVRCLRCETWFHSPDKCTIRLCVACKRHDDAADGLWLAGVPLIDAGWDDADLMGEELTYGD